jgi:DNA-binding transcriptional ArsR family regulator
MKSDTSLEKILKAVSSKKRLELFNYIVNEKFLIKTELITHFNLQRAGLDFHLTALEEAGLIGLLEIKIKGRKYVYVYPKATWKIDLEIVETNALQDTLPQELVEDDFFKMTELFWADSNLKKYPQTIRKILESLALKLKSNASDYYCQRCNNHLGIMKCHECSKLFCPECAEIIKKSDGMRITLCYDCISNQFS